MLQQWKVHCYCIQIGSMLGKWYLLNSKPPSGHTQNFLFSCKCPRTSPWNGFHASRGIAAVGVFFLPDSWHFRDCGGIFWWFVHTTNLGCSFQLGCQQGVLGVKPHLAWRSLWILGQPRRIPKNLGQPKATSPFESCDSWVQDRWRSVRVSQHFEHLVNLRFHQEVLDPTSMIFWSFKKWWFEKKTQRPMLCPLGLPCSRQQKAPALPGLVAGPCASKVRCVERFLNLPFDEQKIWDVYRCPCQWALDLLIPPRHGAWVFKHLREWSSFRLISHISHLQSIGGPL